MTGSALVAVVVVVLIWLNLPPVVGFVLGMALTIIALSVGQAIDRVREPR